MNFWKRHIGDYIRATSHLSLLEHGIYARLLDVYYTGESGIPDSKAARLIGAKSKDEVAALKSVLDEFFTMTEDGVWINSRCERELNSASAKASKNREVGKLGGRPKKNQTETVEKNNHDGFVSEPTKNPSQTPDSRLQTTVSTSTVNNSTGSTPAGAVCARLHHEVGLAEANPMHPKLLALIDAGLTEDELVAAGHDAKSKGKGFAYALAVAEGRRRDAANVNPLPAAGGLSSPGKKTADAAARWLESQGVNP